MQTIAVATAVCEAIIRTQSPINVMLSSHGDRDMPKALGDVEHGGESGGAVHSSSTIISSGSVAPAPAPPPPESEPAPMRNLYTAALSYNGFTITDGALRLIVLLHAADLGFNAIEIAFMFSMYEVSERTFMGRGVGVSVKGCWVAVLRRACQDITTAAAAAPAAGVYFTRTLWFV